MDEGTRGREMLSANMRPRRVVTTMADIKGNVTFNVVAPTWSARYVLATLRYFTYTHTSTPPSFYVARTSTCSTRWTAHCTIHSVHENQRRGRRIRIGLFAVIIYTIHIHCIEISSHCNESSHKICLVTVVTDVFAWGVMQVAMLTDGYTTGSLHS